MDKKGYDYTLAVLCIVRGQHPISILTLHFFKIGYAYPGRVLSKLGADLRVKANVYICFIEDIVHLIFVTELYQLAVIHGHCADHEDVIYVFSSTLPDP